MEKNKFWKKNVCKTNIKKLFLTASLCCDFSGLMYGTVIGITKHTTKNDILNLLEDCNLTPEDLKVRYTPFFSPIGM